jgi:hypothetical protein
VGLNTGQTEPWGQSRVAQHLQDCMLTWHVPLVASEVLRPVSLLGQHVLLLEGHGSPLTMLQSTRHRSVVHCQGPARRAARRRAMRAAPPAGAVQPQHGSTTTWCGTTQARQHQ